MGLYRYLIERDAELDGTVVVELGGRLSADSDLDADRGALLLLPNQIIARHAIDPKQVEELRAGEVS